MFKRIFMSLFVVLMLCLPAFAQDDPSPEMYNNVKYTNTAIKDFNKEIEQVRTAFDQTIKKYNEKDIKGFMSHFAQDDKVVYYDADKDNKIVGYDQIQQKLEQSFSQLKSVNVTVDWQEVSMKDDIAIVNAECQIKKVYPDKKDDYSGFLTMVYENKDGKWLVVSSVISVPRGPQPVNDN